MEWVASNIEITGQFIFIRRVLLIENGQMNNSNLIQNHRRENYYFCLLFSQFAGLYQFNFEWIVNSLRSDDIATSIFMIAYEKLRILHRKRILIAKN